MNRIQRLVLCSFVVLLLGSIGVIHADNPETLTSTYKGLTIYSESWVEPKKEQFVKDTWDQCLQVYSANLKTAPPEDVRIYLFVTKTGYRQKLIEHGVSENAVNNTIGMAFDKEIIINLAPITSAKNQFVTELLAHELAHIWVYELKGDQKLQHRWLSEGYAYYSSKIISAALGFETPEGMRRKALIKTKSHYRYKLEQMSTYEGFVQVFNEVWKEEYNSEIFTANMVTTIDYLINRTSQEQVNQYFSRNIYGKDQTTYLPDDNFSTSFGMDVNAFEKELNDYIKNAKP